MCVLTASDVNSAANVTRQNAVLEQRLVVLEMASDVGAPAIAEGQAVNVATRRLVTSASATNVQARALKLTLRNEAGDVAWGIQAWPVWLVTFKGIGYPLASASAGDCSCAAYYWRPDTAVVVDAQTGEPLLTLGVAE
jgi:hypothetical protein